MGRSPFRHVPNPRRRSSHRVNADHQAMLASRFSHYTPGHSLSAGHHVIREPRPGVPFFGTPGAH